MPRIQAEEKNAGSQGEISQLGEMTTSPVFLSFSTICPFPSMIDIPAYAAIALLSWHE
jgi:hypothetical protein